MRAFHHPRKQMSKINRILKLVEKLDRNKRKTHVLNLLIDCDTFLIANPNYNCI